MGKVSTDITVSTYWDQFVWPPDIGKDQVNVVALTCGGKIPPDRDVLRLTHEYIYSVDLGTHCWVPHYQYFKLLEVQDALRASTPDSPKNAPR